MLAWKGSQYKIQLVLHTLVEQCSEYHMRSGGRAQLLITYKQVTKKNPECCHHHPPINFSIALISSFLG